ncbi:MAG: hypothetical protein B6D41_22700 [Chloroflexi bacterium UTCFX4]|jgi:protein-tyrosine phosphatase|nr:MAG: hypothetical protein B6D41_22700 [Chloroflexi bacterium UTCFX4]
MKQILFLCSGNYYRSRFAEILFNQFAEENVLEWRAESRGIVAQWSRNPGPISQATLEGLRARGISHNATRYPMQLTENDLTRAERIIALHENEHRPMMENYFARWANIIEYWNVPDLDEMRADQALALIEQHARRLTIKLKLSTEMSGQVLQSPHHPITLAQRRVSYG